MGQPKTLVGKRGTGHPPRELFIRKALPYRDTGQEGWKPTFGAGGKGRGRH